MFLDGRLAHPKLVNAVADGFDGLSNRLVLHVRQILRLHGESPDVIGSRVQVVFREAFGNDIQQIFASVRRDTFDHNFVRTVLRVGLGDVCEGDFPLVELFFENFDSVVRVNVHRVVDLHLEDQVSSAPQIQAKVNAVGHGREQALAGKALRNSEDPEQKDE